MFFELISHQRSYDKSGSEVLLTAAFGMVNILIGFSFLARWIGELEKKANSLGSFVFYKTDKFRKLSADECIFKMSANMRTSTNFFIVTALCFLTMLATSIIGQTPVETEKSIIELLDKITKSGNYGGGYDEDKIYAVNEELTKLLVERGTSEAMLKYGFPKLKGQMFVSTSKDGRLRIYSWDMETGGTMHDFASVIQYMGSDGKVYVTAGNQDEEDSGGAFYHDIFQVAGKGGPIYLATSTFIGSSSLNGQSIKTIRINGNKLDLDAKLIKTSEGLQNSVSFSYDFFSVVDRPERPIKLFSFNEKTRSFRFPIVIEDDKTPQGRVTNRYITYRFNGTYFVKR